MPKKGFVFRMAGAIITLEFDPVDNLPHIFEQILKDINDIKSHYIRYLADRNYQNFIVSFGDNHKNWQIKPLESEEQFSERVWNDFLALLTAELKTFFKDFFDDGRDFGKDEWLSYEKMTALQDPEAVEMGRGLLPNEALNRNPLADMKPFKEVYGDNLTPLLDSDGEREQYPEFIIASDLEINGKNNPDNNKGE